MSQSPPPHGPHPTAILRAAGLAVLLLTLVATALLVVGAMATVNRVGSNVPVPPLFAPAACTMMAGIALAAIVEGIARLVGRPSPLSGAPLEMAGDTNGPAIDRLAKAVAEFRSSLPAMLAEVRPTNADSAPIAEVPAVYAEVPYDPDALPAPTPVDPAVIHLDRIVQLLEELKELSLLDETQRQARGNMSKERRKLERVDEAVALIQRHEWEQADALLTLLESLHPGDPDVLARRNELDDLRGSAREAEWNQVVRQVEDLLALSRYDDAATAVAQFRDAYPAHVDAAGLAAQVTSDRDAYVERTATALFNEIKTAVEARQWRMALDGTQRFLVKFPDHARSERIRQQVRTIQKNAEIEERHEQEDRIKELARAGRFNEAADLCEELLGRFPDSPQSGTLQNLLPRLRERSAMAEAAVE